MARIIKLDNFQKKRFERVERKRQTGTKIKRLYFLIVCEGEKTEPNYFQQLKKNLAIGTVDVQMEVEGTARNTNSLVEYTKKYISKSSNDFDRVWVVFDKDSFSDENFNNAIQNAENNGMQVAWSNEAFELWFLLHFEFVNHNMSRHDFKKFLELQVSKKMGREYKYLKNDLNTHNLLQQFGNEIQASKWAEKLEGLFSCNKYAKHNPCTMVYKLVNELRNPEIVWDLLAKT